MTAGVLLFTAAGLISFFGRRQVATTTLVGPWLWAVGGWGFAACVELAIGTMGLSQSLQTALRYTSGVALILPTVSILGAKRPQNQAWHLIVLSLWGILILPAAESYLIRQGSTLHIHDARGWFLWALILTGWLNHALTRFSVEATLYGIAEILWLSPHLPLIRNSHSYSTIAGLLVLCSAACVILRTRNDQSTGDVDELWREFRNGYGAVWGLRIAERVNTMAKNGKNPARLAWQGFDWNKATEEQRRAILRSARSLILQFTSADWWQRRTTDLDHPQNRG